MLIRDTEKIARTVAMAKMEEQRQKETQYLQDQRNNIIEVDPASDVSLLDRQMGRPMTPEALETLIKKLVPDAAFYHNPKNNTMKMAYYKVPPFPIIDPRASSYGISPYHADIMPEWSIMETDYEWEPDPSNPKLDWRDFPRDKAGKILSDDPNTRPGWRKRKVYKRELKRGWRAVLLQLISLRLTTIEALEREVGAADRSSWALLSGKNERAVSLF
jgi:hypothetical protein